MMIILLSWRLVMTLWTSWSLLNHILCLLSQVKGGHVQFAAKHVWLLSNDDPDTWYQGGLRALKRRLEPPIGEVIHMPHVIGAPLLAAPRVWPERARAAPMTVSSEEVMQMSPIGDAVMSMEGTRAVSSAMPSGWPSRRATSPPPLVAAPFAFGRSIVTECPSHRLDGVSSVAEMPSAFVGLFGRGSSGTPIMRTPSPSVSHSPRLTTRLLRTPSPARECWSWWEDNVV